MTSFPIHCMMKIPLVKNTKSKVFKISMVRGSYYKHTLPIHDVICIFNKKSWKKQMLNYFGCNHYIYPIN